MTQPQRWKVYQTHVEEQTDVARASAAGWVVTNREHLPDGTMRVTFTESGWGVPGVVSTASAGGLGSSITQGFGLGCGCLLVLVVIGLGLLFLAAMGRH